MSLFQTRPIPSAGISTDIRRSVKSRLETENLTAGYSDDTVLNGVSIAIQDQSITALIGPNGSGKSTFLKAISRILPLKSGSAILDGEAIHKMATCDVALKLGLLPQGPIAPEGLTVQELVAQGRFPHQSLISQWSRADEAAVKEAMAIAGVIDLADHMVDSLSGGQRQRCWIAMVLAQQTDHILLDEPTTFLDLKVQIDLMELLVDLTRNSGRTLVIVLHDLNLAASYADYLVMMKGGEIAYEGRPEQVFTAEAIEDVFGLNAKVITDPEAGQLICIPLGSRRGHAV